MERLRLLQSDFLFATMHRISSLQQKSRAMCDWTRHGGNAAGNRSLVAREPPSVVECRIVHPVGQHLFIGVSTIRIEKARMLVQVTLYDTTAVDSPVTLSHKLSDGEKWYCIENAPFHRRRS